MTAALPLSYFHPQFFNAPKGIRRGIGLQLDCPHCVSILRSPDRLALLFVNPIHPGDARVPPSAQDGPRWTRTGVTYDTLSLAEIIITPHWTGYIREGQVTTD